MEETKMSDAARECRNKYQREYRKKNPVDHKTYWERRAQKEAQQSAELMDEKCCVQQGNKTDEQYIKALETSNKVLSSENRRLIKIIINTKSR
jgi:hypothetical protein